jgi:hypothetical protein
MMRRSRLILLALTVVAMATVTSTALAGGGNSLNAKSCQKNGWTSLVTTSGASFASEAACVSYAAKGGVLKRPQTISFTSVNPSPVPIGSGASYTPTATATSGLPVAITLDATSSGCSLSGGVVTFTTAGGTCVLDANQPGNATYNAASQVQQEITFAFVASFSDCESFDGTFGSAPGSLWTCTGLSDANTDWPHELSVFCGHDGGSLVITAGEPGLSDAACVR